MIDNETKEKKEIAAENRKSRVLDLINNFQMSQNTH